MYQLALSPCCGPQWTYPEAIAVARRLGVHKFEWFSNPWVASAADVLGDPGCFLATATGAGIHFSSGHMPQVQTGDPDSMAGAVRGLQFARATITPLVLYKADTIETYRQRLPSFLDAAAEAGVIVAIQNHKGSAIQTPDDYRTILDALHDERLKTVLEVGHFHTCGVSWREALDAIGPTVALVHVKDIANGECVPFGQGECDLPGLFEHMRSIGYEGDYVIEIEGALREQGEQALVEGMAFFRKQVLS